MKNTRTFNLDFALFKLESQDATQYLILIASQIFYVFETSLQEITYIINKIVKGQILISNLSKSQIFFFSWNSSSTR